MGSHSITCHPAEVTFPRTANLSALPRTDVDPPRFLPSAGPYRLAAPGAIPCFNKHPYTETAEGRAVPRKLVGDFWLQRATPTLLCGFGLFRASAHTHTTG